MAGEQAHKESLEDKRKAEIAKDHAKRDLAYARKMEEASRKAEEQSRAEREAEREIKR